MKGRLFSLSEANDVLPLVRSITRDAVQSYRAAKLAIRSWEWQRSQATGDVPAALMASHDRLISRHLEDLRRLTNELEGLGCYLRDFERGVVDFPAAAMGPDDFMFYCWVLGEDSILYWRGEEEAYADRHVVELSR